MWFTVGAACQVEREVQKARAELKREMEHQRLVVEQDRVFRERAEGQKQRMSEVIEALDAVSGMIRDLEQSTVAMQNDFVRDRAAAANMQGRESAGSALNASHEGPLRDREGSADSGYFDA